MYPIELSVLVQWIILPHIHVLYVHIHESKQNKCGALNVNMIHHVTYLIEQRKDTSNQK